MEVSNLNTKQAANRGAKLTLRHPVTNEAIDTIVVAGMESDAFRKAKHEMAQRRMDAGGKVSVEQVEADSIKLLAACVISWGDLTINGVTPTDSAAVLTEYSWIREQVDAFVANRANFFLRA
jgi:hypothetical protein